MNKTALQTLIAWGDEMMNQHPMKLLSFAEAIDKAEELLEMEQEQIINARIEAMQDTFSTVNEILSQELKNFPKY
jgi:hypothetical protein